MLLSGFPQCGSYQQGLPGGGNIVHADHVDGPGTTEPRDHRRCQIAGLFFGDTGYFTQEAFPAVTEQYRLLQGGKTVEVFEDGEVVVDRLAETNARVKDDAAAVYSVLIEKGQPFFEKSNNVGNDIVVLRIHLHILGGAEHMHDDNRYICLTNHLNHRAILT